MIITHHTLALVILALVLRVDAADAQSVVPVNSEDRRGFVEASVIADYDQTDLAPGPVLAGGFGIGSRLWPRYSVRFEFDQPHSHVDLFQDNGIEHRWSSKTRSFAVLLGRHFRTSQTIQVVALLGVAALTHQSDLTGFIDVVPRDGRPPTHTVLDDRLVEQWVALSMGVEAPLSLTTHLRLVPQLRVHHVANSDIDGLFPSGKGLLRPRLSLRWQF